MLPNDVTAKATPKFGWIQAALAGLLVAATFAAYLPALHGGFIFDDDIFLTANPLIHAPDGLARFWFSRAATDYWPVTDYPDARRNLAHAQEDMRHP